MTTSAKRLAFIGGLVALALVILAPTFVKELPTWWPSRPLRLGLDLKGGSYLVLGVKAEEAVRSQLDAIAASVRSELRKENAGILKAKAEGPTTLEFTLLGTRGLEKLEKHIKDQYPELVRSKLEQGESRTLVQYQMTPRAAQDLERNAVVQAVETIRNRVDQYGVAEPVIQRIGERRIMVQLPDITNMASVKQTIGSVAKLEFRLVAAPGIPEDETINLKTRDKVSIRLMDQVLMSGNAIERANVEINPQTNETEVTLKLNGIGRKTFADLTSENVGQSLAIVLDNVVQSSPQIREPITGGTAQISGGFTREEAHQLAVVLRSGALPAPLTFEEERVVGASLGADSIRKGITSMIFGSLAVVVFMLFYYKRSGFLAVAGLLLNMLFLISMLSMFGATLTLPGIAGLVLTIGMAVDSNIIIFERIREELRHGAGVKAAIDAGFEKAHWTILDSNLTSLLSGLILYVLGTGPIKGFAVTLCLGLLTTMFCALFVARTGYQFFNFKRANGTLSI